MKGYVWQCMLYGQYCSRAATWTHSTAMNRHRQYAIDLFDLLQWCFTQPFLYTCSIPILTCIKQSFILFMRGWLQKQRVQQHFNNQWSIRTSWELSFMTLLVRVPTLALSLLEPGSCFVDQGQPFSLYFPFVWPSVPSLNTHSWAGMESLSPKKWTNCCC